LFSTVPCPPDFVPSFSASFTFPADSLGPRGKSVDTHSDVDC
jgi:hypothetical protein